MARQQSGPPKPDSSAFEKLSSRAPGETIAHRDVFEDQQLERGVIEQVQTKRTSQIVGWVLGSVVFLLVWFLISLGTMLMGFIAELMPMGGVAPAAEAKTLGSYFFEFNAMKVFLSVGIGAATGLAVSTGMGKRVDANNLMKTTADINQHGDDQHIAVPEEIFAKFDVFPDAGAHSSVSPTSMISHAMLRTKGLKTVPVTRRAKADVIDEQGNVVLYKGEEMVDNNGELLTDKLPMIDEKFGDELFDASGLPKDVKIRKKFEPTKIPYNPNGTDREKLGSTRDGSTVYATMADVINADWEFPEYETQRPGGVYIVDTAPVNTMLIAITRGGKGQGVIMPTLDMWTREKEQQNFVANDPKGELLKEFYVPLVVRGFQPVQFNLINPMKTDIYNPLGMAADAAREGDSPKCAQYVESIANVFFPVDGGEDPVWPNAANNAFKRTAYGLIDFYLEEERELRQHAAVIGMDLAILEQKLDDMWGRVTLYNCYQLFVQLTSKKLPNPEATLQKKVQAGDYNEDTEGLDEAKAEAAAKAFLWEGKSDMDMLTLYFNATAALPTNGNRTLVGNANNALRAMADSEKMLASVYGIAITAMSFFTDPTIATLTSGKPSQNTDLAGISFPRRIGVRFAPNYFKRDHLMGRQAVWSAYSDNMFTESLGTDFDHSDTVSREGWARYYFEGKFPKNEAWIKLELLNPQTKMLVRTFYFHFTKQFQLSPNGRHFVVEPVTGKKIVRDGTLRELRPVRRDGKADGEILRYAYDSLTYPLERLDLTISQVPEKVTVQAQGISQMMVRYSESPKAIFMVTPPHLQQYAKLILILLKQLVDLNFEQSYMTKDTQKPLYKTRFMLDELGNLQSDGNGISGFETMLSIGLGQDQQFTLVLQTMQQLKAVYGDDVDKIVQGNTSNIVFLKSTDDAMIKTLETMSGTTHRSYVDSKTIQQNVDRLIGGRTEGNVSYTMATTEEPLIKYNNMAFIPERNSIVFRAGDAPIWNRNETVLPMAWKLLGNPITHPGHKYTMQTIPTLSSAMGFDVRMNQPDFERMLDRRMAQAVQAGPAKEVYANSYSYEAVDIARLDPDVYSDAVMEIVQMRVNLEEGRDPHAAQVMDADDLAAMNMFNTDEAFENQEVATATAESQVRDQARKRKIYAEGTISPDMLVRGDGKTACLKSLDVELAEAYRVAATEIHADRANFLVSGTGELRSADGRRAYITPVRSGAFAAAAATLNSAAEDEDSRVFADSELSEEDLEALMTVEVHADLYLFLASLPTWEHLADGAFDRAMSVAMRRDPLDR